MKFRVRLLSFYIVVHIHQVSDGLRVVCYIAVSVDGMFDHAACNCKVYHIFRLEFFHHGINQAACERISASYPIQNVKCVRLAFTCLSLIPHICFQAVFTPAVGVANVAGNTFEIGIPGDKLSKNRVLLFIIRMERNALFIVPPLRPR